MFRYRYIYPMAIQTVAAGKVDFKGIVTDIFDFDDIQNEFLHKREADKAEIITALQARYKK